MENILEYTNILWYRYMILYNPNVPADYILSYPNEHIMWNIISRHLSMTMQIIMDNPDKPWDLSVMSKNPNLTLDMIINNLDKPWNWTVLSANTFDQN